MGWGRRKEPSPFPHWRDTGPALHSPLGWPLLSSSFRMKTQAPRAEVSGQWDQGVDLAGLSQSLGSWLDITGMAFPALPCTPPCSPRRSWAPQTTGLGSSGLCGSRGQWEARPWLLQGPWVAWLGSYSGHSSHQNLGQQASSPGLRPAPRPKPASWGNCSLNRVVGRASGTETMDVPNYFLNSRQTHPGWAQPQAPKAPRGPTCAILIKEARLLRHQ